MEKEHKVKAQYDNMATIYDRRWEKYVSSTLGFLEKWIQVKGHENVLDIACGTGALEELLVSRYPALNITGIDISERMLSVARLKLKRYPKAVFQKGRASELPFPDEHFDLVVCASAFHFFDHPEKSLSEMRRVLKTDGKVIILDWCHDYVTCRICDALLKVFDPAHKRCYCQKELRRFLEQAYFRVRAEQRFRFRLVWGMMVAEAIK